MLYPQPFGLQAEYTIGRGPQQGRNNPTVIDDRPLQGGYAQAMFRITDLAGTVALTPYVRGTLYEGGKKFEPNAPRYDVRELEMGLEWHILPALEITGAYMFSHRTVPSPSAAPVYPRERGEVARLQVQFNY
jgi:hypothetical protein